MIVVENLTKRYGLTTAVEDLSFSIEQGEICGLLGPNGAGKTSTMRAITGYLPFSGGSISVAGFDVTRNPLDVKRRIGYLPESTPLYGDMRLEEYLCFAAECKGITGSDVAKEVALVMDKTAITPRRRALIKRLSKGLRQRVGLAQALIGDPELLILDEPTIGLDPAQINDIRGLVKELAGKRTVIISSHILPEVQAICSRVLIINNGKLVADDTPAALSQQFTRRGRLVATLRGPHDQIGRKLGELADISLAERPDRIDVTLTPRDDEPLNRRLITLVAENDWELLSLTEPSLSLEEVYLKLVTSEEEGA